MNKKAIQIFAAFVIVVGLTAALLVRARTSYQLGEPGVKVGNIPIYDNHSNLVSTISVQLPENPLGCSSVLSPVDTTELAMLPPDTLYGRRVYRHDSGFQAAVSVVLMGTDRTSIHKPQYCLVGQGWQIEHSEVMTVPIEQPHPYDLKAMKLSLSKEVRRDGKFQTVKGFFIYWFVADDQLTPYHWERMWWMGRDLLTDGLLQRWAYVAYLSACLPGEEETLLADMTKFIAETAPQFQITTGTPRKGTHAQAAETSATIPLAKAGTL